MSEPHTFWMVHCPELGPPSRRHDTEALARAEAERLALREPGKTFYVLVTTCAVCRSDVNWTEDLAPSIPPF